MSGRPMLDLPFTITVGVKLDLLVPNEKVLVQRNVQVQEVDDDDDDPLEINTENTCRTQSFSLNAVPLLA